MTTRGARAAARFVCLLFCPFLLTGFLWAQNENEAVGFQSNHPFESSHFGEDIDILNGNLHLSIPIGPAYQINQNFGYQLVAGYNSKIWDLSRWDGGAKLEQRGNLGLGFNLGFGRIYRDLEYIIEDGNITSTKCNWLYVSPDGNEHELPVEASPPLVGNACQSTFEGRTIDGSFIQVSGGGGITSAWDGSPASAPTLTVTTPDGTIYTFGRLVQVYKGSYGLNSVANISIGDDSGDLTSYNRDFGGWYVTRITNARANPAKSWVEIVYEDGATKPGYDHLIDKVIDNVDGTQNRIIDFTNDCQTASTPSGCVEENVPSACANPPYTTCNFKQRAATRTNTIAIPAFKQTPGVSNAIVATYHFTYDFQPIVDPIHGASAGQANLLTRINYPDFTTNTGPHTGYALQFDYGDLGAVPHLHFGELSSRTLPTGAVISYQWNLYPYSPVTITTLRAGAPAGYSTQLIRKDVSLPSEGTTGAWFYTRETGQFGTRYTNPLYTIVKDPADNETVYYYRASAPNLSSTAPALASRDTDDGFAPEWNDGANYKVEYYQGNGGARRLVRTETRDYESDIWMGSKRDKANVRVSRQVTIFNDDGGARSTVAYSNWDGQGHYRASAESGDGIVGTRTTRTAYTSADPNVYDYREVSDGGRVLSRTEYQYDQDYPRLPIKMIERFVTPGTIGTPISNAVATGDITTCYHYDTAKNLDLKSITDQATCSTDEGTSDSHRVLVHYTWSGGGYLASKEFDDRDHTGYFLWKAINRTRDGNTGLIYEVRDTAGVKTTYDYDELGRLRTITPAAPEFPTQIEYVDILKTTVRQGDTAVMPADYSCGNVAGDYIMSCHEYDALGRLIKTEKRSYDPVSKNSYQKKFYDILGRVKFESEWLWRLASTTEYCAYPDTSPPPTNPCVGTRYDYKDASDATQTDPFGRVRKVTMADDNSTDPKQTLSEYFGLSTMVTVKGVRGSTGTNFDATTTYRRDAWGRLIGVEVPTAPAGGADAAYVYDLRDNLILVDLIDKTSLKHQTRSLEYDALNRLRSSNDPEGGQVAVIGHDALGNATPGYDVLGNVAERTDASGNRLFFTYDGAGRLTKLERKEYQKPGFADPPLVTLLGNTYDMDGAAYCPSEPPPPPSGPFNACNGRLTKKDSRDEAGSAIRYQEFVYTGLNGRLSTEQNTYAGWPSGAVAPIVTDYNNFGLESQTTYPEGPAGKGGAFRVMYTYTNGHPIEVRDPDETGCSPSPCPAKAKATYNAAGGFQEVSTYGIETTQILPDIRNRPQKITIGKGTYVPGGASPDTFSERTDYRSGDYLYDGAGNIRQIGANIYGYDAANRLVQAIDIDDSASSTYRRQVYTYDDYGNMTQKDQYDIGANLTSRHLFTSQDQTTGLNRNRILNHQSGYTIWGYTYDARGNLMRDDSQAYEVDSRNRMLSVRHLGADVSTEISRYGYDAEAQRVRKEDQIRDLWTFYVRDGQGRLMSEFRRTRKGSYTPEWTKHYLYLGGRLIGMRENVVPAPPGGLKATASVQGTQGYINLTWVASPQGEGITIDHYNVYRSLLSPVSWGVVGSPTTPSFSNQVTKNIWYQYSVTAVDSAGRESYGSDLVAKASTLIQMPSTPTGLAGKAWDRRVDLTWTANTASDFAGYYVYRATGTDTPARITVALLTVPAFADLNLLNGTTYRYSVSVVNTVGTESNHSAEVQATPSDWSPPGPPESVRASADCSGSSAVTVTWDANAWTDGVSQYFVTRSPAFSTGPNPKPVTETQLVDTDTSVGTTYSYSVQAADSNQSSLPSLAVVVRTRDAIGTVPTPAAPYAESGDGKVTLRIPNTSTWKIRVYRKPNVQPDCSAYELIDEFGPDPVSIEEYVDGTVANNAAYDYAVSNVAFPDQESGLSKPALGTPVGHPTNYSECVEERPGYADGVIDCGWTTWMPTPYRRVVARWSAPEGRPYQPYADHAVGTPGYLLGYRVYRYKLNDTVSGTAPDNSTLTPQTYDYDKGYCRYNPDVVCWGGQSIFFDCATLGSYCDTTGINCAQQACTGGTCRPDSCVQIENDGTAHSDYGKCNLSNEPCMVSSDCGPGEWCILVPVDPSLLLAADGHLNLGYRQDYYGGDCMVAKAVYKVFANGNWLTVESEPSDNFNADQLTDRNARCVSWSPDACVDLFTTQVPACPPASTIPQIPAAPTVASSEPGSVTITWGTPVPKSGLCRLYTPSSCGMACPAGQYCSGDDGSKCRLTVPTPCNETSECPTSPVQICVQNTDSVVAGWKLYATEQDQTVAEPSSTVSAARYHFLRTASDTALTFDAGTHSHTFKGLSAKLDSKVSTSFRFRIAAIDRQGRLSELSESSNWITPTPYAGQVTPPASLKAVVWTTNDAIRDWRPAGILLPWYPNPRELNGIKLTWRDDKGVNGGSQPTVLGYRVWRSTTAGGPYCALLKTGTNPPGITICTSDIDGTPGDPNAYSAEYTTGPVGGNRVYVDKTVLQNVPYYYVVTVVATSGVESSYSPEISGMALGHEPQPLSPPAYFKATAPNGTNNDYRGIYLQWCKNDDAEGITGYNVYRSQQALGPYTRLNTGICSVGGQSCLVDSNCTPGVCTPRPIAPSCLEASHRCVIQADGSMIETYGGCVLGINGTCQIVDSTVNQPNTQPIIDQVANFVYYYMVTALRGTLESPYSARNVGWPNYCSGSTEASCFELRYDPDNFTDTPCGDQDASFDGDHRPEDSLLADLEGADFEASKGELAPYRTIGGPPPMPSAVPRFVYYHLDHLGSPRVVVDATGGPPLSKHHYMPFGEELPSEVQNTTNKREFTGHERDPESGLDYMMARYYGSSLGRFQSPDPGKDTKPADPQSWNKYSYVRNNPIAYVDPRGTYGVPGPVSVPPPPGTGRGCGFLPGGCTVWPVGTAPSEHAAANACAGKILCDGAGGSGEGAGEGGAGGENPPRPPGYNPYTWKYGKLDDGSDFLTDPDGNTWRAHQEDPGHWRHWDRNGPNGEDQGKWPKKFRKPWPNQNKPPYGKQSATDPSGDAPGFEPPPYINPMSFYPMPIPFGFPYPMFQPVPILIPAFP